MYDTTIEKNKELVERFPFLIPRNPNGEIQENYDYSCTLLDTMPEGWRKAFGEQMCEEIAAVLKQTGCQDRYRVLQIKEKWGFLCWYDTGAPDDVCKITNKYENLSSKTCVHCGRPATKLSKGWILPWCDECAKESKWYNHFVDIKTGGALNDLP